MTKASNLIETAGFVPNYKIGPETKKSAIHPNRVNDTVKTLITVFGTRPNSDTNTIIIADCFPIVNLFAKERGKGYCKLKIKKFCYIFNGIENNVEFQITDVFILGNVVIPKQIHLRLFSNIFNNIFPVFDIPNRITLLSSM